MGAQMVREVASKSSDFAGDGTTALRASASETHSCMMIHVAAVFGIIDAIAVANIEATLAAILPDPRTGRTGERSAGT
jgi:chaperonin GroEL (HSP60 family)